MRSARTPSAGVLILAVAVLATACTRSRPTPPSNSTPGAHQGSYTPLQCNPDAAAPDSAYVPAKHGGGVEVAGTLRTHAVSVPPAGVGHRAKLRVAMLAGSISGVSVGLDQPLQRKGLITLSYAGCGGADPANLRIGEWADGSVARTYAVIPDSQNQTVSALVDSFSDWVIVAP